VYPVCSYCTDISWRTDNKTLNLPIKPTTLHLIVLNHLLYCSQLTMHDSPSSSRVYRWNPNSRLLTASLIWISAFHYISELNVLFWLEGIYISLFQDQRTTYKTVAWQGRRAMPNTQKLHEGRICKQKFTFVFDKSLFLKQNGTQKSKLHKIVAG